VVLSIQYEVSKIGPKVKRKYDDQEHEPVAFHQLVSRSLQDDSFQLKCRVLQHGTHQSCKWSQWNFI